MDRLAAISRERRALLVGCLLVIEGLASVRIGYASFEFRQGILAFLAGLIVGCAGLLAWVRAPTSRFGPLIVLASAAWFVGGFRWVALDALAAIGSSLAFAYAGVVAHAVLTFPTGRAVDRTTRGWVIAMYVAAVLPLDQPARAVVVASLLLTALAWSAVASDRGRGNPWRPAIALGVPYAVVSGAAPTLPVVVAAGSSIDPRPAVQIALMLVAVGLTATLLRSSDRRSRVADLVVELGSRSGGGLARDLAAAIDDETLEVGFWLPDQQRYVDTLGRAIVPPAPNDPRVTTAIERDGRPVAILVYDATVAGAAGVRAALARAAGLSAANAKLQAEVRAQIAEVEASRRRLLNAAEAERTDLEGRLRRGLDPQLTVVEVALANPSLRTPELKPVLDRIIEQIRLAREELAELAEGLYPRVLAHMGLAGAIGELAARSPVPVHLDVGARLRGSAALDATIYFVCSEALANIARHAGASQVRMQLSRTTDEAIISIEDDGRGDADFARGSGLRGLRDRVEALGGTLSVDSPPAMGTRLVAAVPVSNEPLGAEQVAR